MQYIKMGILFLKIQTSESCVNPLNGAADERHFCRWNTHLNKSISLVLNTSVLCSLTDFVFRM